MFAKIFREKQYTASDVYVRDISQYVIQPKGVHLTLAPHKLLTGSFSVQVKSAACYITGQQGQVQNIIKESQP